MGARVIVLNRAYSSRNCWPRPGESFADAELAPRDNDAADRVCQYFRDHLQKPPWTIIYETSEVVIFEHQ
jgi:hypothetical protein